MARSKRILWLADLCKGYDTVLDIGTDHGLVLKSAFEKGYIRQAIASDLREQPLKSASKNLKDYPAQCVISDGFLAIESPFDLGIISGMGAYLISDILDHAPIGQYDLILQPNDKIHVLRNYLMDHGWQITDEWVIHDHFYYVIIKAKRGSMHLSDDDIIVGPILKTKPEAQDFYKHKLKLIEKIMRTSDETKLIELKRLYQAYNHVIIC
jgi:tRNA (adenine22-N1)-methyltransferase